MTLTTQKDRVPEEAKKMITVELTGSDKQIAYARSILASAITRAINNTMKFVARGTDVSLDIDDRLIQAVNMHSASAFIIENQNAYDFNSKNLVTINN